MPKIPAKSSKPIPATLIPTPRGSVTVRFYAELNVLLPGHLRQKEFSVDLFDHRSVKDLIESFQVPHTEVDLILINDISVGFDSKLQDKDRVAVYPLFEGLDITSVQRLRPEPLRRPAFICDVHLGALAKKLRLLGFDTGYHQELDDEQIVAIQASERRAILTCDRGLLRRKEVRWGYLVRSRHTKTQAIEVLTRFDLKDSLRPFIRCTECNTLLIPANADQIEKLAPEKARRLYAHFTLCPGCGKLYWQGSHIQGIYQWIKELRRQLEIKRTDITPFALTDSR